MDDEFLKKYLLEHQNDIYEITIDGKKFQSKVFDIINFIIQDDYEYWLAYCVYTPYKDIQDQNMSVAYFHYTVLSFFREKFAAMPHSVFSKETNTRLTEIANDETLSLIGKHYQTNNPHASKIKVHPKLKEAILKDMPKYYNSPGFTLLKVIYIYIKMCKILTYDDEFFAMNQDGDIADMHEDITHIGEITPENNKIVCYEFSAIYEAMLKEIGISAEIIKDDVETYGGSHTALMFKVMGGYLIKADSTTSILSGDLFGAKLNLPLKGLVCVNSYNLKNFNDCIKMVYEDIHKTDPDYIPKPKTDDELMWEYISITDAVHSVSLKERILILISKANAIKLKGVDAIAYLMYLKRLLFRDEYRNNINITIIRDNTNEKATIRAIIQIKGIDEESQEYINYYSYSVDQELIPLSHDELQQMFDNGDLAYIRNDGKKTISGIKVK